MVCTSLDFSSQSHSFGHLESQAWNKKYINLRLQKQKIKKIKELANAIKNNGKIRQRLCK